MKVVLIGILKIIITPFVFAIELIFKSLGSGKWKENEMKNKGKE